MSLNAICKDTWWLKKILQRLREREKAMLWIIAGVGYVGYILEKVACNSRKRAAMDRWSLFDPRVLCSGLLLNGGRAHLISPSQVSDQSSRYLGWFPKFLCLVQLSHNLEWVCNEGLEADGIGPLQILCVHVCQKSPFFCKDAAGDEAMQEIPEVPLEKGKEWIQLSTCEPLFELPWYKKSGKMDWLPHSYCIWSKPANGPPSGSPRRIGGIPAGPQWGLFSTSVRYNHLGSLWIWFQPGSSCWSKWGTSIIWVELQLVE